MRQRIFCKNIAIFVQKTRGPLFCEKSLRILVSYETQGIAAYAEEVHAKRYYVRVQQLRLGRIVFEKSLTVSEDQKRLENQKLIFSRSIVFSLHNLVGYAKELLLSRSLD